MGQHAAARLDQRRAQRAHVAIGGEVFARRWPALRAPARSRQSAPARCSDATHARQRPGQVDRGRPRGVEALQGRFQLAAPHRAPSAASISRRRQHHAPGGGDADGRRAAHGQRVDRRGDFVAGACSCRYSTCERQLALVQQFQRVAGPADRADAVVAGVVDVVFHARSLEHARRRGGPARCRRSTHCGIRRGNPVHPDARAVPAPVGVLPRSASSTAGAAGRTPCRPRLRSAAAVCRSDSQRQLAAAADRRMRPLQRTRLRPSHANSARQPCAVQMPSAS